MAFAIEIILSILITAIAYLLIPVIIILTGKKLKEKAIIAIIIINCIVIWFVFRIIQIELNGEPSTGAAAFLWGAIGYWLMKKICLSSKQYTHNSDSHVPISSSSTPSAPADYSLSSTDETPKRHGSFYVPASDLAYIPPENSTIDTTYTYSPKVSPVPTSPNAHKNRIKYCSRCGNKIDPTTKKCTDCGKQYFKGIKRKSVVIVILAILLAVSIAGNVYLYSENLDLYHINIKYIDLYEYSKANIRQLESELSEYEKRYNLYYDFFRDNHSYIEFLDNTVVFVNNDGSYVYHKYDCTKFDISDFYAHNINHAIDIGCTPCPSCCD